MSLMRNALLALDAAVPPRVGSGQAVGALIILA